MFQSSPEETVQQRSKRARFREVTGTLPSAVGSRHDRMGSRGLKTAVRVTNAPRRCRLHAEVLNLNSSLVVVSEELKLTLLISILQNYVTPGEAVAEVTIKAAY